jgi:hypothetical protein
MKMFKDLIKECYKVVKEQKEYRKRPNEYPWGKRTEGYKYFKIEEFENETLLSFNYYGSTLFTLHDHSDEDVIEADGTNLQYVTFTQDYYGNGEVGLMHNLLGAYFTIEQNASKGGIVLSKFDNVDVVMPKQMPVVNGMRYNINTDEPLKEWEYKIVTKKVNPKKGFEVRKKYKEPLTIAKLWLERITYKQLNLQLATVDDSVTLESNPLQYVIDTFRNSHGGHDMHMSTPWNKQERDVIEKDLQKDILNIMRVELYKQEESYVTEEIPWQERRIPSNKHLEIKFLNQSV